MKQPANEIWYHVVYNDNNGKEHNDVYYIYRPGCTLRNEPTHELGRWLAERIARGEKVQVTDFYMEDSERNIVEW